MNEPAGNDEVVPRDGEDEEQVDRNHLTTVVRVVAGCAIALALLACGLLYYNTQVCDEGLTSSGSIVPVCRHLLATDPPIIGLGLVILVALTAFFSEVAGFGISLKRDVRETARKADKAINRANAAESRSDVAEQLALGDRQSSDPHLSGERPDVGTQIQALANEYDTIRAEDPRSSRGRSAKLTTVGSKMISALKGVPRALVEPEVLIASQEGGLRIAGYSYVYANPSATDARLVIDAILSESTRFGEYWAIRALRRVVSAEPAAIDFTSRQQLETHLAGLPQNSDRAYELRELLAVAQRKR